MAQSNGSSAGRAFLYWLVVGIPLTWGVAQSVNAALPLFGGKAAYIPWVLGTPPAKMGTGPAGSAAVAPSLVGPGPSATPTAAATTSVATTPAPTAMPSATPAATPEAVPMSTAQPSATVGPVDTPTVPKT